MKNLDTFVSKLDLPKSKKSVTSRLLDYRIQRLKLQIDQGGQLDHLKIIDRWIEKYD